VNHSATTSYTGNEQTFHLQQFITNKRFLELYVTSEDTVHIEKCKAAVPELISDSPSSQSNIHGVLDIKIELCVELFCCPKCHVKMTGASNLFRNKQEP
jgi:hypothetical protein